MLRKPDLAVVVISLATIGWMLRDESFLVQLLYLVAGAMLGLTARVEYVLAKPRRRIHGR
jgi:hypothetical protein